MEKEFSSVVGFGWRSNRHVIIGAGLVILISLLVTCRSSAGQSDPWWYVFDVTTSVATVAVGLLVWFTEVRQEWEASLPKRMKANFHVQGEVVMRCEEAVLVCESDFRQMAQQVAKQMNGNVWLDLTPNIAIEKPYNDLTAPGGPVRRYEISIELSAVPQVVADRRQAEGKLDGVLVRRSASSPVELMDGRRA